MGCAWLDQQAGGSGACPLRWHLTPLAGKWSALGSLSEAERPRLYHSVAVLMPDCTVSHEPCIAQSKSVGAASAAA